MVGGAAAAPSRVSGPPGVFYAEKRGRVVYSLSRSSPRAPKSWRSFPRAPTRRPRGGRVRARRFAQRDTRERAAAVETVRENNKNEKN